MICIVPCCSNQIYSLWGHTDWIKPCDIRLLQITTIHDNFIAQHQHQTINKDRNITLFLPLSPFYVIFWSIIVSIRHTLIISKWNVHQLIRQYYVVPIHTLGMREYSSCWKLKHRFFTKNKWQKIIFLKLFMNLQKVLNCIRRSFKHFHHRTVFYVIGKCMWF